MPVLVSKGDISYANAIHEEIYLYYISSNRKPLSIKRKNVCASNGICIHFIFVVNHTHTHHRTLFQRLIAVLLFIEIGMSEWGSMDSVYTALQSSPL